MSKKYLSLYEKCYDVVSEKMTNATSGSADGKFVFFDKPFDADINIKERGIGELHDKENVLGVFYSYSRETPSDYIIVKHGKEMYAARLPKCSEDLLTKMLDKLVKMSKKDSINPVPLKWVSSTIAVFVNGITTTRCINCSMGRIASVAEELSHCRVYR